jgi:hypothetical protein
MFNGSRLRKQGFTSEAAEVDLRRWQNTLFSEISLRLKRDGLVIAFGLAEDEIFLVIWGVTSWSKFANLVDLPMAMEDTVADTKSNESRAKRQGETLGDRNI